MAGFAEILAGIGDAAREDRLRKVADEEKRATGIADFLMQESQNEMLTPQRQAELRQAALGAKFGKVKLKELEKLMVDTQLSNRQEPADQLPPPHNNPRVSEAAATAIRGGVPRMEAPAPAALPEPPASLFPAGSVGDLKAKQLRSAEEQRLRLLDRLKNESEERERKRLQAEATMILGPGADPIDVANYVNSKTITRQRPTAPKQKVVDVWISGADGSPQKMRAIELETESGIEHRTLNGVVIDPEKIVAEPKPEREPSSVPVTVQERQDALESFAQQVGKKVEQLSADERTQAVLNYKSKTSPVYTSNGFAIVPQPDGSIQAVPLTRTSGRSFPGATPPASVTGGGQVPSSPGAPSQASKPRGSGRVVGGRELPVDLQRIKANAASGLEAIAKIREELKKDKNALLKEPIGGSRVFAAAKKEAMDVLTRLRTGAALNRDEESFYQNQFPNWKDALIDRNAIEYKLKVYEDLFRRLQSGNVGAMGTPPPSGAADRTQDLRNKYGY